MDYRAGQSSSGNGTAMGDKEVEDDGDYYGANDVCLLGFGGGENTGKGRGRWLGEGEQLPSSSRARGAEASKQQQRSATAAGDQNGGLL